jgi:hypothetical protein
LAVSGYRYHQQPQRLTPTQHKDSLRLALRVVNPLLLGLNWWDRALLKIGFVGRDRPAGRRTHRRKLEMVASPLPPNKTADLPRLVARSLRAPSRLLTLDVEVGHDVTPKDHLR